MRDVEPSMDKEWTTDIFKFFMKVTITEYNKYIFTQYSTGILYRMYTYGMKIYY